MQFEKRAVRLGDIRPSEQNPREDFGDIGALARSIEATGGEPLNPPVVVADGNVYRIVDGERRYRALSSIYGEDREVSALVADTMDEANELVAMLATDDKRQLTEAERARGVQQMLVLGVDEQRIERASRATAGQIRAARRLRGSIEGRQVTLEQLEAASAFDDEKDIEAVLAAGEGWAGKADSIRRRNERKEAKAEDYDAFGDAGIPVVKERPEGFTYKDWAHLGLVAAKLEDKEYPAGTVAVWNDRYWDFFAPKGGEDAEPEKTEEEIRAEQEAAREKAALEELYRSLIGFVASGAFAMSKDLMMEVRVGRADPPALLVAMGGDSNPENEERFGAVRDEFARNLKACKPNEYEAGCWLMAAAKDMAQLNNRWGGDDAEAWLDHYDIFCSAGFEPGEEDVWLMERVRRAPRRRRRMSSEKRVRVTVEACGEARAFECRCATVTTAKGDGSGDSCFVGSTDISDLFALARECTDTLCAAFSQAGVPDRNARKLVLIAALGANPHGHADSIQTTDLDARREIRDMAAELGVDADI